MGRGKRKKVVPQGAVGIGARNKTPPNLGATSIDKDPKIVPQDINVKMSWRFSRMDSGGKGKCSLEALHDYVLKLHEYEKLTKFQIDQKEHCHPCNPKKLSRLGKKRVEAMNLDVETLYQIDLGTPCRLWGAWDNSVFNVIWLDRTHDFYESKKHK